MSLQPGDYEVTVNKINSANFKAFLKIQEGNLNPNNVVFVLDPVSIPIDQPLKYESHYFSLSNIVFASRSSRRCSSVTTG